MRWPWTPKPLIVLASGAWWGDLTVGATAPELKRKHRTGLVWDEGSLAAVVHLERPEWLFFLNWSHIVPREITDWYRCVNFHCTPLPYGRGGGPVENMIRRGYYETVITAHQMTQELDAGAIYGQSEPFSLDGTKQQIQQRFIAPTADLILKIVRGELQPKPQEGEPTYFKRLSPADYEAFWVARGGRV